VVAVPVAEDVLEKRFASKDTVESAPLLALNLCNTCQKPDHRQRDCPGKDCTNGLVQNSSLPATHRPLPQRYICNRCNIPGNWRDDCLDCAEGGAGGGVDRDGVKMRDGEFQNIEPLHQKQELQALPWLPSAHVPPVASLVIVYRYICTFVRIYLVCMYEYTYIHMHTHIYAYIIYI